MELYDFLLHLLVFLGSCIVFTILLNIKTIVFSLYLFWVIKFKIFVGKEMIFIISDIMKPEKYNIKYHIINLILGNNICDINDSAKIIKNINKYNHTHIIIHSTGGNISANDCILEFAKYKTSKVSCYVFNYACSAATMLFFMGDNLYMDKYAMLGPTDPQVVIDGENYSVYAVMKLFENKDKNNIGDKMILEYYDGLKLYYENIKNFKYFIKKHFFRNIKKQKQKQIINLFTEGRISHHTPISYNQIKNSIYISNDIDKSFEFIYKIYKFLW